jgi:hypothetical protein
MAVKEKHVSIENSIELRKFLLPSWERVRMRRKT